MVGAKWDWGLSRRSSRIEETLRSVLLDLSHIVLLEFGPAWPGRKFT